MRTREDRKVVNGEDPHIVKSHKLGVLHLHSEGWDAEAIVTEPEHGISEHQAHDSRLHRAGSLDMLTRTMIWMERERERGHPLHVARKRRDETLKAMNNHHAVVEEIRLRDLHPSDKDLSTSSCAGVSIDRIRGDGDATAWTQGLDLGTKSKSPQIKNCEETRNNVLTKEVRDRAREAGAEGGVLCERRTSVHGVLVESTV